MIHKIYTLQCLSSKNSDLSSADTSAIKYLDNYFHASIANHFYMAPDMAEPRAEHAFELQV